MQRRIAATASPVAFVLLVWSLLSGGRAHGSRIGMEDAPTPAACSGMRCPCGLGTIDGASDDGPSLPSPHAALVPTSM